MLLTTIIKTSSRPQGAWPNPFRAGRAAALATTVTAALAATIATPEVAHANPKPLPFTYFANVQAPGAFEIEALTDLSPVRVLATDAAGATKRVTDLGLGLQTELEVGLTDGLELGWYFVFAQDAAAEGGAMVFDGVKQRLRWQLAPTDAWPVDVALYLELAELHDELEIEEKVILSKRVGAWRFAANLWVEQEYELQSGEWELVYNPTVGVLYDLSPKVSLGLEYWARGKFEDEEEGASESAAGPVQYLGPTLYAATAGPWFSLGAYVRLDALGDAPVTDDPYGKLWVRAVVGFDM